MARIRASLSGSGGGGFATGNTVWVNGAEVAKDPGGNMAAFDVKTGLSEVHKIMMYGFAEQAQTTLNVIVVYDADYSDGTKFFGYGKGNSAGVIRTIDPNPPSQGWIPSLLGISGGTVSWKTGNNANAQNLYWTWWAE